MPYKIIVYARYQGMCIINCLVPPEGNEGDGMIIGAQSWQYPRASMRSLRVSLLIPSTSDKIAAALSSFE